MASAKDGAEAITKSKAEKNPKSDKNSTANETSKKKKSTNGIKGVGEDEDAKPSSKGTKASKGTKRKHLVEEVVPTLDSQDNKKLKKDEQIATSKDIQVPIDEGFTVPGVAKVYIDPSGLIFDVSLNQTNFAQNNNNNKFYRLQVLEHKNGHYTHTRWGRVGNKGDVKVTGPCNLDQAIIDFEKKFKDKTGLAWSNRKGEPKKGKYTFLQMNYEEDDEEPSDPTKPSQHSKTGTSPTEPKRVECKLPEQTQRLIELIFNEKNFEAALIEIGYNSDKLPLGKLGKPTLKKGFEYLRELGDLIADKSVAKSKHGITYKEAVEDFTNRYYSTIPHKFGMKRGPLIDNVAILKAEAEMLGTLSDMEITNEIMKSTRKIKEDPIHVLDQRYQELSLEEMSPLDHSSTEFLEIRSYLVDSSGQSHHIKYNLKEVFRIERCGERARFQNSEFAKAKNSSRRLLWHGSRTTNFGGILSQGLRIAPPEAPVNGYAFGKGVYLADVSSKSANYCMPGANSEDCCLLLCEAELGNPMFEIPTGNSTAEQLCKEKGCVATKGNGKTVPKDWKDASCIHTDLKGVLMPTGGAVDNPAVKNGYLQYNEYIVYDVTQITLRYLLQVEMKFGY